MLRSQLTKLDEVKREREALEGEIKSVTFDMSLRFLTALAQDGAINEEQLSGSQLEQLYGAYNQRVQAGLRTQEELLGQVQVCFRTSVVRSLRKQAVSSVSYRRHARFWIFINKSRRRNPKTQILPCSAVTFICRPRRTSRL